MTRLALVALILAPLFAPTSAESSEIRPRFGALTGIGLFRPGNQLTFDLSANGGVQIMPQFGAYGEIGTMSGIGLGFSGNSNGGSLSVSAMGARYFAPMAEYTNNGFFVAGGPMLTWAGWASITTYADADGNAGQEVAAVSASPSIGFQARLGVVTGKGRDNGGRHGYTIALVTRVMNGQVAEVTQSAGPNGAEQTVSVGDRGWAFSPMLNMGYTFR